MDHNLIVTREEAEFVKGFLSGEVDLPDTSNHDQDAYVMILDFFLDHLKTSEIVNCETTKEEIACLIHRVCQQPQCDHIFEDDSSGEAARLKYLMQLAATCQVSSIFSSTWWRSSWFGLPGHRSEIRSSRIRCLNKKRVGGCTQKIKSSSCSGERKEKKCRFGILSCAS